MLCTERRSTLSRGFGSWEDHIRNLDTEACLGAQKPVRELEHTPWQTCGLLRYLAKAGDSAH